MLLLILSIFCLVVLATAVDVVVVCNPCIDSLVLLPINISIDISERSRCHVSRSVEQIQMDVNKVDENKVSRSE